jgi:MoaA/NifB/PqqE/SkfB family radical SAM enzyme
MKWDYKNLKVFMDVSTYCNAGCPQCHRTNPNGLQKADWLPLIQWSEEQFKKAFPVEELLNVKLFHFCGTWGDPMMNKDILKIFTYISENSPRTSVSVDTNGSIRSEDFWWNLGVLLKEKLTVCFDVDGIDQKMHEKYRRFTSLSTVLNNMNILSQTNAIVTSQTVLFKHNQDYKAQIKELVKKHGSTLHSFVTSDRFLKDNKSVHTDKDGEEFILERADQNSVPKGKVPGTENRSLSSVCIVCRWALPRNEIVINPDGQVLPCCYHANSDFKRKNSPKEVGEGIERYMGPWFKEYIEKSSDYNVFEKPLSTIMNSNWFIKSLPQSIVSENPISVCEKNCSSKTGHVHQLRENHVT